MSARSKGNVGEIKGQDQRGRTVPNIPNLPKFGYKLIELLTHLQVWDSLMLVPIIHTTHIHPTYTPTHTTLVKCVTLWDEHNLVMFTYKILMIDNLLVLNECSWYLRIQILANFKLHNCTVSD